MHPGRCWGQPSPWGTTQIKLPRLAASVSRPCRLLCFTASANTPMRLRKYPHEFALYHLPLDPCGFDPYRLLQTLCGSLTIQIVSKWLCSPSSHASPMWLLYNPHGSVLDHLLAAPCGSCTITCISSRSFATSTMIICVLCTFDELYVCVCPYIQPYIQAYSHVQPCTAHANI